MQTTKLACSILIVVALPLVVDASASEFPKDSSSFEEPAYSILRHQIFIYMPRLLEYPERYLSIQGVDPSDQLTQQLKEIGLLVMPGSEYVAPEPGTTIEDWRSLITVDVLDQPNWTTLKMKYELHSPGSGYGAIFLLELQDGTWVVVSEERGWMQ